MRDDVSSEMWRKSSRSGGNNGNCVEVSSKGRVRDSKNLAGPILTGDLTALVAAVKAGQISA